MDPFRARVIAKALFAGLLAAAPDSGAADGAPVLFDANGKVPLGTLTRVVEPVYPKALLAAGRGGYVDVTGIVTSDESLRDVKYAPDAPTSAAFIEPMKEVVPYWRFRPGLDDDCRPREITVSVRMAFEVVDGQPRVSVLHAIPEDSQRAFKDLRATKRVGPMYPSRARKLGYDATVFAASDVNMEGKVVQVLAYTEPGTRLPAAFADAARVALAQWEFPPSTEHRVRRACYTFDFKLVD